MSTFAGSQGGTAISAKTFVAFVIGITAMTRSANEIVVFFAFGMPAQVMTRSPREITISDMLHVAHIQIVVMLEEHFLILLVAGKQWKIPLDNQ